MRYSQPDGGVSLRIGAALLANIRTPATARSARAEIETRRIAYAIKDPRSPSADFDTAAREMARLIETPCWLVPIPASDGSIRANTILASAIVRHHPGAQIAQAIRRAKPIESQCARHRRNMPSTPENAHHLKATLWNLGHRQVYFVDNVATSGNTLRAAHAAMQRGVGLVFADAGGHSSTNAEPTLFRPPLRLWGRGSG